MANPVAPHTFTKAQLEGLYHGDAEVISTRDYRVFYSPVVGDVRVEVRLNDTETGMPVWFQAVSYTAA